MAVLPVLAALLLGGAAVGAVNRRLGPVLEAKASSQATNLMTQAIDAAVDSCLQENGMSYGDFVTITTDGAGKVTALTSNTAANSRFKRQVVEAVTRQLATLDSDGLGIPLGTLTGQPLLSGKGPSVRVRVDSVGEVTAGYDITATVRLFLPGKILPVSVSSSVCVAETVIVGETPDTYLNLEKGNG